MPRFQGACPADKRMTSDRHAEKKMFFSAERFSILLQTIHVFSKYIKKRPETLKKVFLKSHFNTCFLSFPPSGHRKKPFPFHLHTGEAEKPCILSKTGYPFHSPCLIRYALSTPYVPSILPSTDAHPVHSATPSRSAMEAYDDFPCKNTKDTLDGVFRSSRFTIFLCTSGFFITIVFFDRIATTLYLTVAVYVHPAFFI